MAEKYLNFIGGKWVPAKNGRTFESRNPAKPDDVLGVFPRSDNADVDAAMEAADAAKAEWAEYPAPKRGFILERMVQLLIERRQEIAETITRENGKVFAESNGFDIQAAIDTARGMVGEGRRMFGRTMPSELNDKFAMVIREPLGVVGAITPWNLPILLASWKIFPGLLCGNTIVFKPAEDTPLASTMLTKIVEDAGVPPGVMNMIHGYGGEVGERFVTHPLLNMISFTGSQQVGRLIAERAGPELKKISLELGSKNAVIIMDDAEFDVALNGALWGGYGTSGQRCTAGSRVIVHEAIYDRFIAAYREKVEALVVGDGLDPKSQVGPLINQKQHDKVLGYIDVGVKEGATLLTGGKSLQKEMGGGYFFQPTIFTDVEPSMRIAQEEIFGPVVCVMKANSFDHAIELANSTNFGLSFGLYTADLSRAFTGIKRIKSGVVNVNSPSLGVETGVPFGGQKGSGNGARESGFAAVEEYSQIKSVMIDYSGFHRRTGIAEEHTKR